MHISVKFSCLCTSKRRSPFEVKSSWVDVAKCTYFHPVPPLLSWVANECTYFHHIPGSHIFEKSRFLKKRFRLRIVSKIDLAGSRGMRRKYFSKMPDNIPPKDPFGQRGAPHLELLLYSARFACPETHISPQNPPKERGAISGPSFLRL